MSKNQIKPEQKISTDWLLKGVLTKIGETFDRLTGRNWKPSSSLATSELVEKIKKLLDVEVKDLCKEGKFVPHNIKLKIQWDKFSTDSDKAIESLKNELHIAAIDHINDKRYYTYAPINIEITSDYFTEGVKLLASFEKFDEEEREAAVNVTLPDLKVKDLIPETENLFEREKEIFVVGFAINGKNKEFELKFDVGERKSIGRTKENDLMIEDNSISKIHAAFVFNSQSQLVLADTGSTNGTFINGQRIAYGRAFPVNDGDSLKFGTVDVSLKRFAAEPEIVEIEENQIDVQTENDAKTEILSDEQSPGISEIFKTSDGKNELSDSSNLSNKSDERIGEIKPTEQGIILDFSDNKSN